MGAALVIMAAGLGSRYGGDKQLEGVGPHGELLMHYSICDALRGGFDKVVFVIKPEMEPLMTRLVGEIPAEVRYVYQSNPVPRRTKPFGTAHAMLCAREAVEEPFCVINADDYYGADAYRIMYDTLQRLPSQGHAAMVGYLLKNTVTDHGTVSRGLCHTENGRLISIREVLKIARREDGSVASLEGEQPRLLEGDGVVSMNFWGFAPSIFGDAEAYFRQFLCTRGNDPAAECQLPAMVDALMGEGRLQVAVLSSREAWFGMTYREDRERVAAALRALHDAGVYGEKLW